MGRPIFTFPRKAVGPVAWCTRCSRKHPRRGSCGLVEVTRTAKSGKEVTRWAHPEPSSTPTKSRKRKIRARKS